MPRVWQGYSDVDQAIETIQTCLKETGQVPDALVKAYQTSIQRSGHGLVQRFYEGLAEKCPEALRYFTEEPDKQD